MITFWRAAPSRDPHFGFGSYWTRSTDFAAYFRRWLDETLPQQGPHVIYRACVEFREADHLEIPFLIHRGELLITSAAMTRDRLAGFASDGYRWISFHDGVTENVSSREYIYLGREPIIAEQVAELPSRSTLAERR